MGGGWGLGVVGGGGVKIYSPALSGFVKHPSSDEQVFKMFPLETLTNVSKETSSSYKGPFGNAFHNRQKQIGGLYQQNIFYLNSMLSLQCSNVPTNVQFIFDLPQLRM